MGTDTHLLMAERAEDLSLLMAERLIVDPQDQTDEGQAQDDSTSGLRGTAGLAVPPSDAVVLRVSDAVEQPRCVVGAW